VQKVSVVNLAKRYGDAMKASVKTMGPEMLDVVLFFRHIESIFKRFDVPAKLQAALIQLYLNDKARSVVSRMDPSQCDDYKTVRDVILKEHKLTPCAYLDLFNKLTRTVGETTVMYCAKLKSLLSMYVESRMVNSFDGLMSLIVCDHIKSTLSESCLRHVLSVQAVTTKGWLEAQALTECVDQFRANHFENDKPRASAIGDTRKANCTGSGGGSNPMRSGQARNTGTTAGQLVTGQSVATAVAPAGAAADFNPSSKLTCFKCKQPGHTRRFCPNPPAMGRSSKCTITTLSVMPQGNAGAMATAEPQCSTANIVPCQPVFG